MIAHTKHLAFNDQEAYRNGICVWLNEQEARELMLLPFEYALSPENGNSMAVMTSFNRAGTVWLGASRNVNEEIARGEWGFLGYSITDMAVSNGATYMTYQDGTLNGTNLFMGSGSENALDAYKSSATVARRLRDSSHHILYAVANTSAAMNGITPDMTIGATTWWWRTAITAAAIVMAVLTCGSAVMWVYTDRKKKK